MTVNGVMAVILRYFTEFVSFRANYAVVEVKHILSATKSIPKNLTFGNI